jgi:hypothetical protein|tara:strand:+ start:705 stop:965 length:261 start_codon:yes stop_codon:yes gene_type:complete
MKVKQSVEYEGKKIPLPFLIAKETLNTNMTKVKNRFNGDETELPEFAVAVYDVIMGSEMLQDWKTHRKGLDFFIKYFPKQYMVLLD